MFNFIKLLHLNKKLNKKSLEESLGTVEEKDCKTLLEDLKRGSKELNRAEILTDIIKVLPNTFAIVVKPALEDLIIPDKVLSSALEKDLPYWFKYESENYTFIIFTIQAVLRILEEERHNIDPVDIRIINNLLKDKNEKHILALLGQLGKMGKLPLKQEKVNVILKKLLYNIGKPISTEEALIMMCK